MAHRLVKLAEYNYRPAVQGVVARPAYCRTTSYRKPVTTFVTSWNDDAWRYSDIVDTSNPNDSPHYGAGWMPGDAGWLVPGGTTLDVTVVTRYETVYETTCFPAIEGVEERGEVLEDVTPIAWDSGAASLDSVSGDINFGFVFSPDCVGAICGLSSPADPVADHNAIRYGLRVTDGVMSVVERGVVKATIAFDPAARIRIRRVGTQVTYHVGDWEYESDTPSTGVMVALACLYVSGDYVENPILAPIQLIEVESSWGWVDYDTARAISSLIPWGWEVDATVGDGFVYVDLTCEVVASQELQGTARVDVGGVGVRTNDTVVVVSSGLTYRTPLVATASGVTVGVGGTDADVGGIICLASDYSYGEARVDVGAVGVAALSYDEPPGVGTASEVAMLLSTFSLDPVLYAAIHDTLQVGDSIDILLVIDAATVDYLVAGDSIDASMVLSALLESRMQVSDHAGAVRAAVLQYATNLLTGAVGRYEGFDFRGFVKSGMQTYGWKPDGLYRMGYAEDTGEEIQAMIDFAAEDFDTTNRKSIRALFFGVDTDGALYARLVDDNDCEATYRVIPHGDTQRANPAQRPTSRFWRLRLEIVGATFADLDNVEWKAATTGRRTRS